MEEGRSFANEILPDIDIYLLLCQKNKINDTCTQKSEKFYPKSTEKSKI